MIAWAVALMVGVATGLALTTLLLNGVLGSAAFRRRNYRHADLATAGGVIVIVGVVVLAALGAVIEAVDLNAVDDIPGWSRTAVVLAVVGFGALGLLDDLGGDRSSRGFAGHLAALRQGRPTTGTVKLLGGAAVGIVVASVIPDVASSVGRVVVAGAVVALAANAANLFDLAPGRCVKVTTAVVVGVVVTSIAGDHVGAEGAVLAVLGIALAMTRAEFAETLMIGDTGANALGATVGVLIVGAFGTAGHLLALAALVLVNAAAEFVSFSEIIDRVGPLRWLDRWGRRS